MSDMTGRLRRFLAERGVEWEALPDQQEGDLTITATRWHDGEGGLLTMLISEPYGGTWDFFWLPTPEQAIAATLGAVEYRKPTTLSQLEAENAKLREQMERLVTLLRNDCDIDASWDGLRGFWTIGLTEDGCLMRDRVCKAEAENAKLRELCETFGMIANDAICDYYDRDELLVQANVDARELGVEL